MTTSQPVEIELKLALLPQRVAAFTKLMARQRNAPVQEELITRYFDTPDFSLSALGVAVRVRRAGRHWLQTLKTEGERHGGLSRRPEYEMPISRSKPDWEKFPPEARALVPEALRAQLVVVFETRFNRTAWLIDNHGGAEIEVALDVGEVRAGRRSQPICEIELELRAGQPDALFVLAQGWARRLDCVPLDDSKADRGVRLARGEETTPAKSAPLALDGGMRVEDGFAAICQACVTQFLANLPGVLASDDIEYVHQARVALRRLRAALRLYRDVCAVPDALLADLRALAAALGSARDWDVLCGETLPAIAPHYADAAAWQRGWQALEAHRAGVRAAMRVALAQAHPGAWLLAFQRWLLQRGWRAAAETQRFVQLSPLKKWARRALQKGHRPIVRGARKFGQLQPEQRHALRIAIKRQRYAAEFFQELFARSGQVRYQAVLRDAQDSLGRANDARVASGLLAEARLDAEPMGQFVLGWLAAQQVAEMTDAAGANAKHLQNFMETAPYW
ncbi:CYTH and CHAD domain-containing protein [Thiobacillus denitrificans]|uniref:CYTH and CHAD domain-containing protein n=1 Tax=Thiobacillus denitrificans TaxID=36861 RepID=UPI00037A0594|nr:CYTH and CHAD domain-containing protein [Thiobacillus denitrificans]